MRVFRHFTDIPADARGAVAVLGNFDGLHRGHRAVIEAGRATARSLGAPLAVVTFEPHPRSFFQPDAPPFRLTSFRTKARLVAEAGADLLFALHFDLAFSHLSARAFADEVLKQGLGLRQAIAGYNFAFGHKRAGDAAALVALGSEHGFGVGIVDAVTMGEARYSSTRIRESLKAGDARAAARMLGRWWEIEGHVIEGDRRGRSLGFPTANLALGELLEPKLGVYAVWAGLEENGVMRWHPAVANLGRRPTFGIHAVGLEVHVLDFEGDLYGRQMRVAMVEFIRPEMRFSGPDHLKAQIARDSAQAGAILARADAAVAGVPATGG